MRRRVLDREDELAEVAAAARSRGDRGRAGDRPGRQTNAAAVLSHALNSLGTAGNHVAAVLDKLGVRSRTEAAEWHRQRSESKGPIAAKE